MINKFATCVLALFAATALSAADANLLYSVNVDLTTSGTTTVMGASGGGVIKSIQCKVNTAVTGGAWAFLEISTDGGSTWARANGVTYLFASSWYGGFGIGTQTGANVNDTSMVMSLNVPFASTLSVRTNNIVPATTGALTCFIQL